ncbi:hypothetical protein LMJ37_23160 [Xanthomonas citri pv. glycines]|uniref:hypothetical protein n=1 Tax=Xanthomonas citri TaxID=346 RepID=UPI001F36305E|nr:hypothetical protein [Xanthomonas citri]UIX76054.1 hypothetical protein LMJ37_23160 [Xanthomonas citri pv. glycines]
MSEDALLVQLRTLELRLLDPQQRADVQVLKRCLIRHLASSVRRAIGTRGAR